MLFYNNHNSTVNDTGTADAVIIYIRPNPNFNFTVLPTTYSIVGGTVGKILALVKTNSFQRLHTACRHFG